MRRTTSIKKLLLAWLLPSCALFIGLGWFIHGLLLDTISREFVHDRLHQEAEFIENQIRDSYPDVNLSQVANTYFDEVLHHTFAVQVGNETFFSHDRWRAQIEPWLNSGNNDFFSIPHNDEHPQTTSDFLAYRTVFHIQGKTAIILVAEDYSVLKSGQKNLHLWTAGVSVALLFLLIGIILLAVRMALRPVGELRAELTQLQSGSLERLDAEAPLEFKGLIEQLNGLLDTLDQRMKRSRQAMANLSHSLKTPITAVIQVLNEKDTPLDAELRTSMADRLTNLTQQLEAEMLRGRFSGPQIGKTAHPFNQCREITWMLSQLHENRNFEIEGNINENRRWPIEEHDFNELVGNLADNAGKWAGYRITVRLQESDSDFRLIVSDDGPGVEPSERQSLGRRGLRLDEQTPGHGLGLAIVRDIAGHYGGFLNFSESPEGGLQVTVSIPRH